MTNTKLANTRWLQLASQNQPFHCTSWKLWKLLQPIKVPTTVPDWSCFQDAMEDEPTFFRLSLSEVEWTRSSGWRNQLLWKTEIVSTAEGSAGLSQGSGWSLNILICHVKQGPAVKWKAFLYPLQQYCRVQPAPNHPLSWATVVLIAPTNHPNDASLECVCVRLIQIE